MKKLFKYIILLLSFHSCGEPKALQPSNININDVQKKHAKVESAQPTLKLPLGDENLIAIKFPKKWDNLMGVDDTAPKFSFEKTSKKGYDSLFYFIEKKGNAVYDLYNFKIKSNSGIKIPEFAVKDLIKLYDNSVILDSAYYVGTISENTKYSLQLYRNGDRYKSNLMTGNDKASFNYLCLVTFTRDKMPIDYKIIYYNNFDHILSYKRFFYINEDLKISTMDFEVDELATKLIETAHHTVSSTGKFTKYNNE